MITGKDELFRGKRGRIDDFDFGTATAAVFDDMLLRSVPFYAETQRMITQLVQDFAVRDTNLYDLGCSTGTTFQMLDGLLAPEVRFIGIDSSEAMLEKARAKLQDVNSARSVELVCADLNKGVTIENASVAIMNLTLQFVRPLYRERIIRQIASGINDDGCLLLVEKVLSPHSTINRLFINHYYEFKRYNGYSELEIARKREALENILVPYHYHENSELLLESGFKGCDMFFRWYNFCGIIAVK